MDTSNDPRAVLDELMCTCPYWPGVREYAPVRGFCVDDQAAFKAVKDFQTFQEMARDADFQATLASLNDDIDSADEFLDVLQWDLITDHAKTVLKEVEDLAGEYRAAILKLEAIEKRAAILKQAGTA
jgi:hypothetical protein